ALALAWVWMLQRQVLRRTAILLALGLFLNWFPFYTVHWERARILGVLQRIALVYALAALAYLRLGSRVRLWLSAGLLAAYWLAMTLVPVPGFGAGDLSAAGNLAGWVDHAVLGQHVWRYAPGPADPEGLLSTLPAVVTALAGVATGEWLRSAKSLLEKILGLLLTGNLLLAAGLAANPLFPINKNLWTSSYVLFTAGFALVLLGMALYAVDVRGGGRWTVPFEMLGANSIAAFFGSTFVAKLLYVIRVPGTDGQSVGLGSWLYTRSFELWLPPYWASLAWALLYLLLWLALMGWLYRRRIFLKV
nr:DUF5009 domain-containing protein [Thermoanaerobaculia bacterium]